MNSSYGVTKNYKKQQISDASLSLHFLQLTSQLRSTHLPVSTTSGQITQMDFHHYQKTFPLLNARSRVLITNEQIRFEIVTLNDSGEYRCEIPVNFFLII